ncbi:hypothetical protein, partial [Herminiimonas sp.]|uniref:hypothetical protein n=1 Tax=Herminiimonas sp. TaxID=1926289 RepID=UPI00272D2222
MTRLFFLRFSSPRSQLFLFDGNSERFLCCLLTVADPVFSSWILSCREWPGGHLLSLLRQRKKAKKGDAAAVARCADPQVQHTSVGGTNKLAFGSNRFAPFIRLTRTGLG